MDITKRLKLRGIKDYTHSEYNRFLKLYDKYLLEYKRNADTEAFDRAVEDIFGNIENKTDRIVALLEEIDRIPERILIKIQEIEEISDKSFDRKEIKNIERNVKNLVNKILKEIME